MLPEQRNNGMTMNCLHEWLWRWMSVYICEVCECAYVYVCACVWVCMCRFHSTGHSPCVPPIFQMGLILLSSGDKQNSLMELAVIWGHFSCSDLACYDLACSDLACSELACSDLAHSDLGPFFVKILTFFIQYSQLISHTPNWNKFGQMELLHIVAQQYPHINQKNCPVSILTHKMSLLYFCAIWMADIHFKETFLLTEELWRSSVGCLGAFHLVFWFSIQIQLALIFLSLSRLMVVIHPLDTRFKRTKFAVNSISVVYTMSFCFCVLTT